MEKGRILYVVMCVQEGESSLMRADDSWHDAVFTTQRFAYAFIASYLESHPDWDDDDSRFEVVRVQIVQ